MSPFNIKSLLLCSAILSGLWLVTCKTTPTPSQPEARKQQTQKPTEARPPTASDSTASEQPAAAEKPETGQKETDPNLSAPQTSASSSAKSRLEKARDDLRVSQATEERVASELEQLKKSENASAEDIRNYETYLERVRAMVAENRQTVAKMEAVYAEHTPGKAASESSAPEESEKLSDPSIPEENAPDQVAELDRRLRASLSEFDAALQKKMETIETESAAKMRDLAQQAAEAAKHLKEKGAESESEQTEATDEGSTQGEADQPKDAKDSSTKPKSPQTEPDEGDDAAVAGGQSEASGPGPQGGPGSRYSKEDDDIVARQLREAAEKETDPELKAKLWKEYEAYKKNTGP